MYYIGCDVRTKFRKFLSVLTSLTIKKTVHRQERLLKKAGVLLVDLTARVRYQLIAFGAWGGVVVKALR